MAADDSFEAYFSNVVAVDAPGASRVVLDLLDNGTPVEQIISTLLGPAQLRVGSLWEQGRWSVADEHAATAVTDTALSVLAAAAGGRHRGQGRHVAMACAEGEWHTMPARMAAAVAATGEARVTVLGPSMPADQLGRRLQAGDIDVLALSCTLPTNLIGAARCVAAAHDCGVPVVAGGSAFGVDPRRAHAIGVDLWATDPAVLIAVEPALMGRPTDIPTEAMLLDAATDSTVTLTYDRLLATFPRLSRMPAWQQVRTREDLVWMSRFTGAAVVTADPTILDDFLAWLLRLLDGKVDPTVITTTAHLMAESIEPDAPRGASLLRTAADTLEPILAAPAGGGV